jgi:formate dehydrogenase subunit gamma
MNPMANLLRRVRLVAGALAIAFMLIPAAPTNAQLVNPTAESVKEQLLLDETKRVAGECSIPDEKACMLEQLRGRDLRYVHDVVLRLAGGAAILGMLALVAAFYFIRGPVRMEPGRSGRVMVRFSAFERFVHWMATVCFIILTLSGLNVTFGKALVLPLVGAEGFSTLALWGKYAHNYLSFPFTLSVVLIFLMWFRWNLPSRIDIQWIKEGGGFGEKHPPADLFNAGQKSIYWVVVLGGAFVAVTGYVLMFPFYGTGIVAMQIALAVHGLVALLYIAAMVFHIYMGSVGEEGAFEGMWDGVVDENWSKQHHSIWYDREVAKGNIPKPPEAGKTHPEAAVGKVHPAE